VVALRAPPSLVLCVDAAHSLCAPYAARRPQVPLFETLDDLNNAPGTCRQLFSNDWYRTHIKGVQECMIGERSCC